MCYQLFSRGKKKMIVKLTSLWSKMVIFLYKHIHHTVKLSWLENEELLQTSREIPRISKIPVRLQKNWPHCALLKQRKTGEKVKGGAIPNAPWAAKNYPFLLCIILVIHTQGKCVVRIRVYLLSSMKLSCWIVFILLFLGKKG